MNPLRKFILLAGLLLLAFPEMPAMAVDTYQITIDSNSPEIISTGLWMNEGDNILVQAQGAMRLTGDTSFYDGWFDPSGQGSVQRPDQPLEESPFGGLLGQYSDTVFNEFVLGDLTDFTVYSTGNERELQLMVNMSATDLSQIEGSFVVHITRFLSEEATNTTVTIDSDSPRPLATGVVPGSGDKLLVIAQGVINVATPGQVTQGWFDASGVGKFNRTGQLVDNMAYGSLLGSFTGDLAGAFFIGDNGSWVTPSGGGGNELGLLLNMSAEYQPDVVGELKVHILKISTDTLAAVGDDGLPAAKAIVSLDNYPNPFNPMTTVRFELGRPQEVRVSIVNVAGKLVKNLAQRTYGAGKHHLNWDGRDNRGQIQASGIYFLRLDTEEAVLTHKLTLVR